MYCQNCGQEIVEGMTSCPFCNSEIKQKKQWTPYYKRNNKTSSTSPIITTVAGIVGVIFLINAFQGVWDLGESWDQYPEKVTSYTTPSSITINTNKDPLELVGDAIMTSSGAYGYYTYHIEGILKNVSGRKIDYAQVSFVIYDSAGNNVGSAFDNVNYIDVNGTWKFQATYWGQEQNIKYNPVPEITTW